MPLKKVLPKPGVNRENTRYTNEGGWYECDKIRFRQGTPEKIGGWVRISASTFLGVCRSLWNWVTLGALNLLGVGTNLKFYIENGGAYYDVTPLRSVVTLTGPFATTSGSSTVVVTDAAGGFLTGDYVTFNGASAVAGLTISGEYQITVLSTTTYSITASGTANATTSGGGTVQAMYQINTGPEYAVPLTGWGAGTFGGGAWGIGSASTDSLRLWSQSNFGEDLIFGPRGGGMYIWNASLGLLSPAVTMTIASPAVLTCAQSIVEGDLIRITTTGALPTGLTVGTLYYARNVSGATFNVSATPTGALINTSGSQSGTHTLITRAELLTNYSGASGVPTVQNYIFVSDINRFVFAFGANEIGSSIQDPMLFRWSDQEDATNWTPAATNQAGSLRLSHGSEIVTANQSRQEILVWTDSSLYSVQYLGSASGVWGAQLMGDSLSIVGPNAVAYANGVSYWMGKDKFYKYDGRVQPLRCDLRKYVFQDINTSQYAQVVAGTNEGFNEAWWFYCSEGSTTVDKYVVYNYLEDVWYYGEMARTAWLDSGLRNYPIAATYSHNIVNHEQGVDDDITGTPAAITAYITSAEFDLDDGHTFAFIWRVLPDITFSGSTTDSPTATMYLLPLRNSGSGYLVNDATNANHSVANNSYATITRTAVLPVEKFTGQIYTRVRGRQLAMKIESTDVGVTWQLGSPRLDMRPDGRR